MTLIGVVNFNIDITSTLKKNQDICLLCSFINEMTGPYTVLLLLPFLVWFFKRFPLTKNNWFKRLPVHLSVSVIYGVCFTILLIAIRKIIYWIIGMEPYDPGIFIYRFLMEFQKQVIIYWFIYGTGALAYYIKENHERRLRTSHLEQQLNQARLKALKMQLNPHFLFNTLNMISSYMYDDVKIADRMITNLSDLLRLTLSSGESQEGPLKKELEILKLYLEIMKARFGERLQIQLDIHPDTLQTKFPHLTLQPLVENSIKYSMNEPSKIGSITIRSELNENRFLLTIKDNGPGLKNDTSSSLKKGTGLKTIIERLHHLYGDDHTLKLTNHPEGGVHILIEIPFHHSTKEVSQKC